MPSGYVLAGAYSGGLPQVQHTPVRRVLVEYRISECRKPEFEYNAEYCQVGHSYMDDDFQGNRHSSLLTCRNSVTDLPAMEKSHPPLDLSLKRKRGIVACVNCRARKVRCNVEDGIPCHNCVTDKISCSIVQRKRRYPRPDWGSDICGQEVKQDTTCVSTPSSSYSTNSLFRAQSPADHCNSEGRTRATAIPQYPSSESEPAAHCDQEIAMWLLSCPESLSSGLPDHLLATITRASLRKRAQTPHKSLLRQAFQDCLRHVGNMLEYRPPTPVTTPSSSSGSRYRQSSSYNADHSRAACDWPEDVQNLLNTCKDLIAVSCRLSSTIVSSTTNLNRQENAETPREFSEGDDVGVYFNDSLPDISQASWDETDYTLPVDELGANGFDCLLGTLDFEATLNQKPEEEDT